MVRRGKLPGQGAGVLALACAAQFMVVLDVSVVNVALPSIRAALGFDPAGLQWVVGAYALVFAGFLLPGGRLADLLGHRRTFLLGLALFTGASLVGGLAASPGTLTAMRALQGLGAAVLAPATLTILTAAHPEGPSRTRALAVWTAVSSAGGAAGNLIGGVLTDTLSWRWILLINVPVGALALLAAIRLLPTGAGDGPGPARGASGGSGSTVRRLDVLGAVLATVGVGGLVHGLSRAGADGWSSPAAVTGVAVGLVSLAAFAAVEARWARAPLVPARLVRLRAVLAGNAVMLLAGACFIPMWYFLSLHMQEALGYGALATGVGFLPHTLVGIVAARCAPAVMRRTGARTLIVLSALLAAVGFLWQSAAGAADGYLVGMLGPGIVMSAGMGLLVTPVTVLATSGVAADDAGAASGLMNAARQMGGAIGLAALVTLPGTASREPGGPTDAIPAYGPVFTAIALLCALVAALAAVALPRSHDGAAVQPEGGRGSCEGVEEVSGRNQGLS
ncbi:MFS transporter [Streptomyces sp. HNM0574]|uniref:MFS transporter n=1 Tax=Streptomyces sp. HNM0574 TaxID=2714954 RepID=UPI00146E5D5B|nr:MFS transporter [Streptomyces sp. HNM0574]NLU66042.1 MFS transporter [Streptomyces sp. HNM0574]